MRIECTTELTNDQLSHWQDLLTKSAHMHPEQDPRFAPVLRSEGHVVVFTLGWVGADLRAAGLFRLQAHPMIKGRYGHAMSYSGPVCDDRSEMAAFINALAVNDTFRRVGSIRITPYWLGTEATELGIALKASGIIPFEPEDSRQTGLVDISGAETDIAARFSQTGRRKLRKAERLGLTIETVKDAAVAMEILPIMNEHRVVRGLPAISRARFRAAFENVYRTDDLGTLLVLRHQGRFVAALVLHRGRDTAHFMNSVHDDAILAELDNVRIAPFLLLEGMKWANRRGCSLFDLEGYKEPLIPNDPLQHIYKYKSEFYPKHVSRIAGYQKIVNPLTYLTGNAQEIVKPYAKSILRKFKPQQSKVRPASD